VATYSILPIGQFFVVAQIFFSPTSAVASVFAKSCISMVPIEYRTYIPRGYGLVGFITRRFVGRTHFSSPPRMLRTRDLYHNHGE